jgi:hypothetical protein
MQAMAHYRHRRLTFSIARRHAGGVTRFLSTGRGPIVV